MGDEECCGGYTTPSNQRFDTPAGGEEYHVTN